MHSFKLSALVAKNESQILHNRDSRAHFKIFTWRIFKMYMETKLQIISCLIESRVELSFYLQVPPYFSSLVDICRLQFLRVSSKFPSISTWKCEALLFWLEITSWISHGHGFNSILVAIKQILTDKIAVNLFLLQNCWKFVKERYVLSPLSSPSTPSPSDFPKLLVQRLSSPVFSGRKLSRFSVPRQSWLLIFLFSGNEFKMEVESCSLVLFK